MSPATYRLRSAALGGLLLVLSLLTPAGAEETIATSPLLPSDYSPVTVRDREGRFVGRILPEGRYWVTLDRIPAFLRSALIAVEDTRFYEHGGIDLRGIARAMVKNIAKGRFAEGGSTITQQLVKNKHLSADKTIDRKVQEGLLAIEYEKKYTKSQILEMYFNEIYYGHGAWGIAQAARLYYDKRPEELSEAECAVLAGVPKNPGRYNPLGKATDVAARRNVVLRRLVELQLIDARKESALRAGLPSVAKASQAPQYLDHVKSKLIDRFGPRVIENGGLEVTAALDLNLQRLAEQVVREGVGKVGPELQGALLAVDPWSGDILAAVGSVDYATSSYNRALFARRQPGSAIKPLIYAAAVDMGVTPSSRWDDTPVVYTWGKKSWRPYNYGRELLGEISLREALAHSNNVIAVKLLDQVGVPDFLDFARRLGLHLRTPNDLSLALGTDDVTLHDLTLAYAPFATGGLRPESRTIVRVVDRRDGTRRDYPTLDDEVLDPATAFVTTEMLRDVLTVGTARGLKSFAAARPAAGKTGTTDDYRDAWFIGFTPQMIAGVWVGYDQPRPGGKGFTGGAVAAPIWERFMRPALASEPVVDFVQPETVVSVVIDPESGSPATPECPEARTEFYLVGSEPTEPCPLHSIPTERADDN